MSASPPAPAYDTMDLTDVRILATAVQRLMMEHACAWLPHVQPVAASDSPPDAKSSSSSSGGGGGKGKRLVAPVGPAVPRVTAEGTPRVVIGKHVIVSLGARGVLWVGPPHGSDIIIDAAAQPPSLHIPALPLPPGRAGVVNTSGAGDAFVAGMIHHACTGRDGGAGGGRGLTADSLRAGLARAAEVLQSATSN